MRPADSRRPRVATRGQMSEVESLTPECDTSSPPAQVPEILTRRECAALLRVSLGTLDRLRLPRHLVGCSPRYHRDEIVAWVRAQSGEP